MGRAIKLDDEAIWCIRNQVFPKTLAEWAAFYDVSVPVIVNARKCKGGYDFGFKQEFIDEMLAKYGHLLNQQVA
jgi:hypothetical protein